MVGPWELWKDACISVKKLFFTFRPNVCPIAPPPAHPKGSSRTVLQHLTNVRRGSPGLTLLPPVHWVTEHDSALLWASVSLCAKGKQIGDHQPSEMGSCAVKIQQNKDWSCPLEL